MRDNTFDNFIKEKVNNHASAVPTDMWQRIMQEKKKDRKVIWWNSQLLLIAGILLMSIAAGSYFWYNAASNENDFAIYNQKNVANELPSNRKKLLSSTIQKSSNIEALINIEVKASSAEPTEKTKAAFIRNTSSSKANSVETIATHLSVSNPLFSLRNRLKLGQPKGKNNIDGEQIVQPFMSDWEASVNKSNTNFLPEISKLNRPTGLANLKTNMNALKISGFQKIDCPKSGDAQNGDWFIEVYGSPDLVTKQNTLNKGTSTRLLQSKDSSESRQLSFTAGVRFSKELGENMVFKTGFQFTQMNEKFTNRIENERRLTTVVTTRTIIGSQGQTILVKDTSVTEQIGYSQTTSYNRYRSIDIPLLLGYVFTLDGWQIGVNGGPILNIKSWQEGEGLDANLLPVSFAKNKATVYKKNTGFGLYGGVSIIKWVGARTSVFAEPYIRYNLSSLTNSSSIVNEKYKLSGMLLGVRYNLSNFKATH